MLLFKLLSKIFPHLGGPQIDVITEISQLTPLEYDSLDSYQLRASQLEERLEYANQPIPINAIIQKFIKTLMLEKRIKIPLSPIHLELDAHLLNKGHHTKFRLSLIDTYDTIVRSGIDPTITLQFHHIRPQLNNALLSDSTVADNANMSEDPMLTPLDVNYSSQISRHSGYRQR